MLTTGENPSVHSAFGVIEWSSEEIDMRREALGTAMILASCIGVSACGKPEWRPYGVCFLEAAPGATSRYRTFTPVRCDAPSAGSVGETVGADHAALSFRDVDGDGRDEAVVESSAQRCRTAATPCYDTWRIVMRYDPSATPPVRVVSREPLPRLTPEG